MSAAHLHGATDGQHPVAQFRAEKRQADDSQSQTLHLRDNVERSPALLVFLPLLEHRFGRVGHDFGETREVLTVKSGLRQTALPPPKIPFADEQAVAE